MARARTEQEIRRAFDNDVLASDPSIDVVKGPLAFQIRNPVAKILRATEEKSVHLSRLYSTRFLAEATDDEFQAISDNFAKQQKLGKPSRGRLTFFTYVRPVAGEEIVADAGTVGTTKNREIEVVTLEAAVIDGDQADNYWNATKRRWEVTVLAESVGTGSQYDVPPLRIVRFEPAIARFDGVENPSRFRRGSQQETRERLFQRLQNTFIGALNRGTFAGQKSVVLEEAAAIAGDGYEDTAIAISMVFPADRKEFRRRVDGPAADIIVLNSDAAISDDGIDEFFATAGQTTFRPSKQPVKEIVAVRVNNVGISDYTFQKDETVTTGFSGRATDSVVIGFSLNENDSVVIQYAYNELVNNLQESATAGANLFRTDFLYREPNSVQVQVQVEIFPLTSTPPEEADIKEQVAGVVSGYMTGGLAGVYTPETLRSLIEEQLGFTARVRILKLHRVVLAAADIEVVRLAKNEQVELVFDLDDDVIIRR